MSRLTTSRAGHAYAIDGERVASVTTIIGKLDKPALKAWAAREAATWAATHVDLLPAIGEQEWIDQAANAHNRVSRTAMAKGTTVHEMARRVMAGEPVDVPAELEGMVKAAADFLDTWGVWEVAAERPCYHAEWRYAGTFDVLAKLSDGRTWLLDWKTGKGPWPEQALQLAAYAACTHYQDDDGNDVAMPAVERMGFVMLSDSGWDFVPVVADPDRLFAVFSRLIAVNGFVEWTTPNRNGQARWPVLGEPLPRPVVAS